jgi:hypothetical protein
MTIVDFIENNKLTDKKVLRLATGAPDCMPDEFLPKILYPIGVGQFKTSGWSDDDNMISGKHYPIYHHEGSRFVVDENGNGRKFEPASYQHIVWF